jgi:hypothetical protein
LSEAAQAAPASADTAAPAAATPTPAPAPAAAVGGDGGQSPAPAPAPVADTAGAAPVGTDLNGSGQESGTPNDWTASLDADTRTLVEQKGWKDANAAMKSYRELVSKLGEKTLAPPAEDAGQDEWDGFYAKMGRPEKPDGYQFNMPEGVPEDMPYDGHFAMKFKNWAHEEGLSPRQADALHAKYVREMAGSIGQQNEARVTQIEKAHGDIVKEWGDTESEGYKRNLEMSRRALTQLGVREDFIAAGIIDAQSGMITSAKVAKALARVGAKMFAEDTMYSGPASLGKNPFSEKEFNMTEQSLLIKNDPAKAATLIRAAGEKPEDYGLRGQ